MTDHNCTSHFTSTFNLDFNYNYYLQLLNWINLRKDNQCAFKNTLFFISMWEINHKYVGLYICQHHKPKCIEIKLVCL